MLKAVQVWPTDGIVIGHYGKNGETPERIDDVVSLLGFHN